MLNGSEAQYTNAQQPLVGELGQSTIQSVLSHTEQPGNAIKEIQLKASLRNHHCRPLLSLLDELGVTRLETHTSMLESAKQVLGSRIESMQEEGLLALLEETFPYVSIDGLRSVPLDILKRLEAVPEAYLQELGEDHHLFAELPPSVQRQVYEVNRKLLQEHAAPLMAVYLHGVAVVRQELNMDVGGKSIKGPPTRQTYRKTLAHLVKLVNMIGGSPKVYRGMMDLCVSKFKESEGLYVGPNQGGYCLLRSQLLMAFHDNASFRQLANEDPCHDLAWILDAAIAHSRDAPEQGQEGGVLKPAHTASLKKFFRDFDSKQNTGRAKKRKYLSGGSEGESPLYSEGDWHDDYGKVIAEAGMILRDPSALHLIIKQVLHRLPVIFEAQGVPSEDEDLVFLTRLLQLAVGCRQMLKEKRYAFPPVKMELAGDFFAILIGFSMEAALDDSYDAQDGVLDEPNEQLVDLLMREEVVRHVTAMYTLERIAARDWARTRTLMASINQALSLLDERALPEWAAFAATLARRMAELLPQQQVGLGDPVWRACVDCFLLKAVDIDSQVHGEVVRIFAEGADQHLKHEEQAKQHKATAAKTGTSYQPRLDPFPVPVLVDYLHKCLAATKHSRKRHKKRKQEEMQFIKGNKKHHGGYSSGGGLTSKGPIVDEADQEGRLDVNSDNTDGVRSEYAILAPSRSGESSGTSLGDRLKLTKDMAPDLFSYLKID